ncbi:MAG: hypothetical protein ACPG4K_08990, partial [Haloferula sp.]
AAEDDELGVRLRKEGGQLVRIDRDSTLHDADMHTAAQWWRRAKRCGHGYAQVASLHGAPPERKFVDNLKKLYERQLEVAKLIAEGRPAIGMTVEEVGKALGKPTKTTARQTKKGRTGIWEFITYDEISHYNYVRDPLTGKVFRQLSHVTREERGKIVVEFENEVVTAIEETENDNDGGVKIIVPPIIFGW